jgi:indolepyruvate ferredoxin oxidoreductase beta subunit
MINNKSENNVSSGRRDPCFADHIKRSKAMLDKGMTLSVLFAGVGGQGIILATTVLSQAALAEGLDVKVSEVHGMAQRGGSVLGSVRFGEKVYSPTVGKADFFVALEKLEALRYLDILKSEGLLLASDYSICPTTVYLEGKEYPKDIEDRIGKSIDNYMLVDVVRIAKGLKEIRSANMVMMGLLSNFLPISDKAWISSIKENFPKKAVDINLKAFKNGKEI